MSDPTSNGVELLHPLRLPRLDLTPTGTYLLVILSFVHIQMLCEWLRLWKLGVTVVVLSADLSREKNIYPLTR